MKEEQMILFARALSRCNLSEKDQEVLTAVAMTYQDIRMFFEPVI